MSCGRCFVGGRLVAAGSSTTAQMFAVMNSQFGPAEIERLRQTFNHIVHGDPNSIPFNLIDLAAGA